MTIILGVLLGLLSTLGAVAHAMTTSRQRTIAVSLAKQTIENIQGADWANVADRDRRDHRRPVGHAWDAVEVRR